LDGGNERRDQRGDEDQAAARHDHRRKGLFGDRLVQCDGSARLHKRAALYGDGGRRTIRAAATEIGIGRVCSSAVLKTALVRTYREHYTSNASKTGGRFAAIPLHMQQNGSSARLAGGARPP